MEFLRFSVTLIGSTAVAAAAVTLLIYGLVRRSEHKTSQQSTPAARRIAV
jgi:hypothetical protein